MPLYGDRTFSLVIPAPFPPWYRADMAIPGGRIAAPFARGQCRSRAW
jgi:hypothetical protein